MARQATVDGRRPKAVMLSKRACVFYLEHVRIMQHDDRVVYLTEEQSGIDKFVSVPDKNTSFILLGKGSSITDSAVRKLAESNVLVGFCGSGGSPLFAELDMAFLLPQDEYRPTQYAQAWFKFWVDDGLRLEAAKRFLRFRIQWGRAQYATFGIEIPHAPSAAFLKAIDAAGDTTNLLAAEGRYAMGLYAVLARTFGVNDFVRSPGAKRKETITDRVNGLLDHGNYLAYGYAAVCLHGLGIPYFLPLLHGKTRRGALVFDTADLFKDWLVMPQAFICAKSEKDDGYFRAQIIEQAIRHDVLDHVMGLLKDMTTDFRSSG